MGNNFAIKMKYPTYDVMKALKDDETVIDRKIKVIAACIDTVQKGEEVFTRKDFTHKEIIDFIEELSEAQYMKLEEFIDNFPYFVVDIDIECPKCKTKHRKEYRDFSSFFR